MKCPRGCESATFLENTKVVSNQNSKLLLDSDGQQSQENTVVKIYTCNCCHNSFEISEGNSTGKMVL
jgi:hypothetical protein